MTTTIYQSALGPQYPTPQHLERSSFLRSVVATPGASGALRLHTPPPCAICRYRARCGYEGERGLCRARERDVREPSTAPATGGRSYECCYRRRAFAGLASLAAWWTERQNGGDRRDHRTRPQGYLWNRGSIPRASTGRGSSVARLLGCGAAAHAVVSAD